MLVLCCSYLFFFYHLSCLTFFELLPGSVVLCLIWGRSQLLLLHMFPLPSPPPSSSIPIMHVLHLL